MSQELATHIEILRNELVQTVQSTGLEHPETIELS